jgi:hypothetical protein
MTRKSEEIVRQKTFRTHLIDYEPSAEQLTRFQDFLRARGWRPNWSKRLATFMLFDTGEVYENRFDRLLAISASTITQERLLILYGPDEGKNRWEQYREKQRFSNTFEYKAQKYGWEEDKFNSYNKSRSITLKNLVIKHGETLGLQKWEDYCERQRYTNTLAYFVEREGGNEMGLRAWTTYNHEKGSSRRPPDIAKRYKISIEEAEAICSERFITTGFVSKAEMRFVQNFELRVGPVAFTYKTKQWCMWSAVLEAPVFYDLTCPTRRKIVEFHGDYWHANPQKYPFDWVGPNGVTASNIWLRDEIKRDLASQRGFLYRAVWESDELDFDELKEWWND